MADENDFERTEPASQRRLEQAREEGQVPQSRELSAFLVMIAGAAGLWVMGGWLAERLSVLMRHGLALERQAAFDTSAMSRMLLDLSGRALAASAPLFVLLILAALAGPFALGGFVFSPKALNADLSRIDPLKGFGRMFSVNGLAELVKAIAKTLLVGGVALWVIWRQRDALAGVLGQSLPGGMASVSAAIAHSAVLIVAAMALVAAADVPFQLWQYHRRLRMTKEEVKREARELEGDPQLKARIRSQQREIARRRMMQQVPKADVIVTNPTRFAVALKYEAEGMRAPTVVAKGRGEVAAKIREIGALGRVPMLEAPSLARALYRHAEIGDEVPAALYGAVAEVMAYVYQLHAHLAGAASAPRAPEAIPVPEGMDPWGPQ
ncbi:MAG TPA: flagellar biosynthetic protein FlhB [Rhodocyclaceae bacterium]|nr:MAG: flagellar biosynthesis protein FlhB [Betaproteobacteria bacterium CG2_30_68_42]PIV73575.1 MAG: flagellar biosynthetic protein FlhB [Rhodocyclales bacterium CG17_big_fil_post_rev_8_21_14_2_50_68_7]PJA57954.1 MAG: flagellar biosynthetic protein FlhB [Rhodocyclales bacterium CG_4_9_14_3_um_filter_68_10]HCX34771.1 flagellar biosynthetic protein FlhB [Rhodocyclaceae bacterium]